MSNKELFKEAHKMAKEIKKEYPKVNYMFQFSLCLSYLKERGEEIMRELQGSEKQITWAEDIRNNMLKMLDDKIIEVETDKKATKAEVMRNKEYFEDAKTVAEVRVGYLNVLSQVKAALLLKEDARWFITYRTMDVETLVINYCGDSKETVFSEVC